MAGKKETEEKKRKRAQNRRKSDSARQRLCSDSEYDCENENLENSSCASESPSDDSVQCTPPNINANAICQEHGTPISAVLKQTRDVIDNDFPSPGGKGLMSSNLYSSAPNLTPMNLAQSNVDNSIPENDVVNSTEHNSACIGLPQPITQGPTDKSQVHVVPKTSENMAAHASCGQKQKPSEFEEYTRCSLNKILKTVNKHETSLLGVIKTQNSINDQLKNMDHSLSSIRNEVFSLENTVQSVKTDVSAIEHSLSFLNAEVDELKSLHSNQVKAIHSLETMSQRHHDRLAAQESELQDCRMVVARLQDDFRDLNENMSSAKSNIIELYTAQKRVTMPIQTIVPERDVHPQNGQCTNNMITGGVRIPSCPDDTSYAPYAPHHTEHPQARNMQSRSNHEPVNVLIVGSSTTKHFSARRLSSATCNTRVRTFRGAKIADMRDNLDNCWEVESAHKLVIHVGTNNIATTSLGDIEHDYYSLIYYLKNKAPNAELYLSSILPRPNDDQTNREIVAANVVLENICRSENVQFIDNSNVFFSNRSARQVKGQLFEDRIHVGINGTKLLSENMFTKMSLASTIDASIWTLRKTTDNQSSFTQRRYPVKLPFPSRPQYPQHQQRQPYQPPNPFPHRAPAYSTFDAHGPQMFPQSRQNLNNIVSQPNQQMYNNPSWPLFGDHPR